MEVTPNVTDLIFTGDPPAVGDPAEDYFEASKLSRRLSHVQVPGVYMLEANPWLIEATARAGQALEHRPAVDLPARPSSGEGPSLSALLSARRSPESFTAAVAPTLAQLSAWCWATAGRTGAISRVHHGRTYPSGGAMFPCDLFVAVAGSSDLDGGTYYYDPNDHRLLLVNEHGPDRYGDTTAQPETFANSSAVWIIVAALWRSRFKYGQRALRFTLLEAGHMVQNLLLAVGADGHAGRAIGGFFDDELADVMAVDGIHEVPVYLAVTGVPAPSLLPVVAATPRSNGHG